jgi:hypothetical protein
MNDCSKVMIALKREIRKGVIRGLLGDIMGALHVFEKSEALAVFQSGQ